MFSGARNTAIYGGVFTQVSREYNGLKVLHENVAPGAFHNSAERYDPPKCHPGTREAVIKDIMEWTETENRTEPFLWMYGPAGAGKSAIAQTIAEVCSGSGLLGASFFFSRTASGRNDATLLIATLAYQLTVSFPEMAKLVSVAIDKDPLIFTRSVKAQLDILILQPLSSLHARQNQPRAHPKIIIIDGLDECGTGHIQGHILDSLASSVAQYPVPLIFLIASRPEQAIRGAFNDDRMEPCTRRLVLDDHYLPDADIQLFLTSEFETIKKRHPLCTHLPSSWPSDPELAKLVEKSSGQFIYASTVAKFIRSPRHRPTEQLNIILGLSYSGTRSPFSELDALYSHILSSSDNIENILDVFAYIFLVIQKTEIEPWSSHRPTDLRDLHWIEKFLEYEPGDLQFILADLHSLLFVPHPGSPARELRIYHASLGDFLMDRSRSGTFFIITPKAFAQMTVHCIHHNSTLLKSRHCPLGDQDSHLNVSFLRFMDLCASADPTPELLQALASFSFDQVLEISGVIAKGSWIDSWDFIAIHLPGFIKWLHEKCPSPHSETCLCTRYMTFFDGYFRTALSAYPPTDRQWRSMLAALTLDSTCVFDRLSLQTVILGPELGSQLGAKWLRGVPYDYMANDRKSEFRSMLTAFLVAQTRSGAYWVDKTNYIQLAMKCIDYLHLHHISTTTRIERRAHQTKMAEQCASSITLAILSRFPKDPTLAKCLRTPSGSENVESEQTRLAIDAYVQEYESDQLKLERKKRELELERQELELESKKPRKWLRPFKFQFTSIRTPK